jgi:hypothetical protein
MAMSDTFELTVMSEPFVVSRLEAQSAVPPWALDGPGFAAVCRTDDELSIIAAEDRVPDAPAAAPRWRGLKVHGPFPFDTIGVLAAISRALADARVSLLAVSTHDTDYIFVQSPDLARAVRALRHAGHAVHTPPAVGPDA